MSLQYCLRATLVLVILFQSGECAASESEEIAVIQALPLERCQKDLVKLHDIHGQMLNMNEEQRATFLSLIAEDIKAQGLPIPPPPPPCSPVHIALEKRCGNIAAVKNKCSVALANAR